MILLLYDLHASANVPLYTQTCNLYTLRPRVNPFCATLINVPCASNPCISTFLAASPFKLDVFSLGIAFRAMYFFVNNPHTFLLTNFLLPWFNLNWRSPFDFHHQPCSIAFLLLHDYPSVISIGHAGKFTIDTLIPILYEIISANYFLRFFDFGSFGNRRSISFNIFVFPIPSSASSSTIEMFSPVETLDFALPITASSKTSNVCSSSFSSLRSGFRLITLAVETCVSSSDDVLEASPLLNSISLLRQFWFC